MWLSKRETPGKRDASALTGPVTLPGSKVAAWLGGERREVAVFSPGGYHWAPQLGEQLLVLKAGQSGEEPCAVGVLVQGEELSPGEILITTGKSAIRMDPEGNVALTGTLTVNGMVLGPRLEPEVKEPAQGEEDDEGEEEEES